MTSLIKYTVKKETYLIGDLLYFNSIRRVSGSLGDLRSGLTSALASLFSVTHPLEKSFNSFAKRLPQHEPDELLSSIIFEIQSTTINELIF